MFVSFVSLRPDFFLFFGVDGVEGVESCSGSEAIGLHKKDTHMYIYNILSR